MASAELTITVAYRHRRKGWHRVPGIWLRNYQKYRAEYKPIIAGFIAYILATHIIYFPDLGKESDLV